MPLVYSGTVGTERKFANIPLCNCTRTSYRERIAWIDELHRHCHVESLKWKKWKCIYSSLWYNGRTICCLPECCLRKSLQKVIWFFRRRRETSSSIWRSLKRLLKFKLFKKTFSPRTGDLRVWKNFLEWTTFFFCFFKFQFSEFSFYFKT